MLISLSNEELKDKILFQNVLLKDGRTGDIVDFIDRECMVMDVEIGYLDYETIDVSIGDIEKILSANK